MSTTETKKQCLECGTANAEDCSTCCYCGGGSFPDTVAAMHASERKPSERRARQHAALTEQLAILERWEAASPEERDTMWAAGERPPGMCKDCPDPKTPCLGCFTAAGYGADAYEMWLVDTGRKPAPAPETKPEGVSVVQHPEQAAALIASFAAGPGQATIDHPEAPVTIPASPAPPANKPECCSPEKPHVLAPGEQTPIIVDAPHYIDQLGPADHDDGRLSATITDGPKPIMTIEEAAAPLVDDQGKTVDLPPAAPPVEPAPIQTPKPNVPAPSRGGSRRR